MAVTGVFCGVPGLQHFYDQDYLISMKVANNDS